MYLGSIAGKLIELSFFHFQPWSSRSVALDWWIVNPKNDPDESWDVHNQNDFLKHDRDSSPR